jgi:hypothetical protein
MNIEIDKAFDFYIAFSYFVYIALLLGIFTTVPSYLTMLNSFVKLLISCVLMYKFNPLQKNYILSRFDKKIVFSSGVYLLLTTFIGEYLVQYEDLIKTTFHQYIGI